MSEVRRISQDTYLNDNSYRAYSNRLEEVLNHISMADNGQTAVSINTNFMQKIESQLFAAENWPCLLADLKGCVCNDGFISDTQHWHYLFENLKKAAFLQEQLKEQKKEQDPFATYARLYDEIIGQPCLDGFIGAYIDFVLEEHHTVKSERAALDFLSIGCGTGLMEAHLLDHHGFKRENLLGTDLSAPMVDVAQNRIQAHVANVLELEDLNQQWDITFTGLNVLQYLTPENLENAIQVISRTTKKGGLFFGDFITPDHIRCYPNFIQSRSQNIISLRLPKLLEKTNKTFQQSEIINLYKDDEKIHITYEGKHLRYLPSMLRVRQVFEKAFSGNITFYDAVSLSPLPFEADTSPSTRYLIVAQT